MNDRGQMKKNDSASNAVVRDQLFSTHISTKTDSVPKFDHGKYAGCISKHLDLGYTFAYRENGKQRTKFFKFGKDNIGHARLLAEHDAMAKALIYQKEYSDSRGLTRNQWRRVGDVIEVKLQNGLIMTCDPDMLKHVEARVWTARKGEGKKTYYASCRKSEKMKYEACQFHNLVCPQFKQVDHIDRNGLNNCRSNLKEGSGRIHAQKKNKQKNNTSGHTGVEWYEPSGSRKGRWKAVWKDEEGKRKSKSFTVVDEEDKERMKALAIAHREAMVKKTREFLGMM